MLRQTHNLLDNFYNATVVLSTADGKYEISGVTSASGLVSFVAPLGECNVSIAADGYLASSRIITIERDTSGTFSKVIGLTPTDVSIVDGSLSVKEMTYEEIVDAGIDLTNEDNYHVTKMELEVQFVAAAAAPVPIPVEVYFNAAGQLLPDLGNFGWTTVSDDREEDDGGTEGTVGPATTQGGETKIGVFPISEHFILVVYGEAHWLKEMYNVELLVINNSYMDDLTDCVATLELPDGLPEEVNSEEF